MIAKLLISPSLKTRVEEIQNILGKNNLKRNHPDVLYFEEGEKLGIEEARQIKEHFSFKPYQAKGKAVVLEDASTLTQEAQNALLKTLEEPPEEAILILGAKSESDLLPTILSRCQIVILEGAQAIDKRSLQAPLIESNNKDSIDPSGLQNDIEKLLQSSQEERFEYIERLKDREQLLSALVQYFRQELHAPRRPPFGLSPQGRRLARLEVKNFLEELLEAEKWAKQNVNIRAILEYLMLVMPAKM